MQTLFVDLQTVFVMLYGEYVGLLVALMIVVGIMAAIFLMWLLTLRIVVRSAP
jgi:hypothetical protein